MLNNNFIMEHIYVDDYCLDKQQSKVVFCDKKNILVVAGAGSGKSLTIVGKIKYLIESKNVNPNEILCISFTNDSAKSLEQKLKNYKVEVLTFHKLGLNILKENSSYYQICPNDYLEYVIHEFFMGIILDNNFLMKKVLNYFNIIIFINTKDCYQKFICNNYNKLISLEKLICRFIKLFKSNNYSVDSFITFKKRVFGRKENSFLSLVLNIFLFYENELASSLMIDFDDMLVKAIGLVSKSNVVSNYKYIIVDEYQDTSYIRYLLIKTILDKNKANLIAVGDDFQSIYRFSGCDLDVFTSFEKYFDSSDILKLENTYRNSQELIGVAGRFVMKNKMQINKQLKSLKRRQTPIKICYDVLLEDLIKRINTDIMILGRNNKDIDQIIKENVFLKFDKNSNIAYYSEPKLKISFFTVHRSKGLEEENVIILNVIDNDLGFPNKVEDDSIIRLVTKGRNHYPFDEERRLFYVALTRTKNDVYLLTKKNRESLFIKELLKDYRQFIEIIKK